MHIHGPSAHTRGEPGACVTHVHTCIHMCMCIYVYVMHIPAESQALASHIYTYIHTYIYVYTHACNAHTRGEPGARVPINGLATTTTKAKAKAVFQAILKVDVPHVPPPSTPPRVAPSRQPLPAQEALLVRRRRPEQNAQAISDRQGVSIPKTRSCNRPPAVTPALPPDLGAHGLALRLDVGVGRSAPLACLQQVPPAATQHAGRQQHI